MEPKKFRKLNLDLPREPVVDDRAWRIMGWVFAVAFLAFTAYAYLEYKGMF